MHPRFDVFGLSIPAYWLCAVAGLAVCSLVAFFRHKNFKGLQSVDLTNSAALIMVGVLVGGRVMSMLSMVPVLIARWDILSQNPELIVELFSNGMVFYGGLFGACSALHVYVRHYRLNPDWFFDFFIPLFPLFHAFGRVGCFLNGCCHGFESEAFGIAYTDSLSAPNGVPFFPIQLVCAGLNLVLFFWLVRFERRHHLEGKAIYAYLAAYAPARFVVEFFRGDAIRGLYFGLSTSQWISLAIMLVLSLRWLRLLRPACAGSGVLADEQNDCACGDDRADRHEDKAENPDL